jgi:molybdopterin-guanine dinucleotide biosynthesis protein A
MTRASRWPHTGAVLAGGRSVRMGQPKRDLVFGGRTLLERAVELLERVCRAVVVVGGRAPGGSVRHLSDLRAGQGPLGGIEALLASDFDTEYLVLPCDLPLVDREVLEALLAPVAADVTVLRLAHEAEPRPLPVRIAAAALPRVRVMLDQGRRAVRGLLPEAAVIEAPAEWVQRLANVNTQEDYRGLRAPEGAE